MNVERWAGQAAIAADTRILALALKLMTSRASKLSDDWFRGEGRSWSLAPQVARRALRKRMEGP